MAHDDKRWRLISYDIREPARYRRAFKLLKGYGHGVQYSVFRCRLDARELERLRWELAGVLASEDALLIVNLCPSCAAHISSSGHFDDWGDEGEPFRVFPARAAEQAPARVGLPILVANAKPAPRQRNHSREPVGDA